MTGLRTFDSCAAQSSKSRGGALRLAAQAGNSHRLEVAMKTKGEEKRAKNSKRVKLTIIDGNE